MSHSEVTDTKVILITSPIIGKASSSLPLLLLVKHVHRLYQSNSYNKVIPASLSTPLQQGVACFIQ